MRQPQAEKAKRERAEEDRLVVHLRSRFLLRVLRLSARRQRKERDLIRIAACSTAGSLRRTPAGKQTAVVPSSAMVLKVGLRQTLNIMSCGCQIQQN